MRDMTLSEKKIAKIANDFYFTEILVILATIHILVALPHETVGVNQKRLMWPYGREK